MNARQHRREHDRQRSPGALHAIESSRHSHELGMRVGQRRRLLTRPRPEQHASRERHQRGRSSRGRRASFGNRGQQLHRREVGGRRGAASSRLTPGAGKSSSTRRPSSRIQRRSSRSTGSEPSRAAATSSPERSSSHDLSVLHGARAVERRRQWLTVRRFEGIPVVTAVAPAGEPMQTPGSREVPADRVDRTRVRRHDVDPHPPPQHRIERGDQVRVIIAGITGRDERSVTSPSRRRGPRRAALAQGRLAATAAAPPIARRLASRWRVREDPPSRWNVAR